MAYYYLLQIFAAQIHLFPGTFGQMIYTRLRNLKVTCLAMSLPTPEIIDGKNKNVTNQLRDLQTSKCRPRHPPSRLCCWIFSIDGIKHCICPHTMSSNLQNIFYRI